MNLHSLTNTKGARKRKMRVGRGEGSGKGKTSGRGHKGQMSRSGSRHKPTFEGGQMPLVRRIPKRGFNNRSRTVYLPVNIADLAQFEEGAEVNAEMLRDAGLAKGTVTRIKILGNGELGKKLMVKAHSFSSSAREKIEAAGGTCEVIK
ncbi:MAG: 50S ribosomal protein L15 [Verrucomicrobia bacterium]|nr:50S ribosomal protein L15 [Verrucomicrobiota bacterium]